MKLDLKKSLRGLLPSFPVTHLAFPVLTKDDARQPKRAASIKNRGVALLISIMAVAMIMIFTSDMILNSQVGLELSTAQRDNIKAEYMAKSATNLAIFLLSGDWAYDLAMYGGSMGPPVEPTDKASDFWAMLNGIPIGGDSAELLEQMQEGFNLSNIRDDKTIEILKYFDGHFLMDVEDEGAKINVNECSDGRCDEVMLMLEALMSCPAEKTFLQNKKLDGLTMAYRIKDWIDKGARGEPQSGHNNENDPYQRFTPPYKTKSAPMDSVDELLLVDGWDDEMHKVFSPFVTVFPFRKANSKGIKINLNTASDQMLLCLMPESKLDCSDKVIKLMVDRMKDGNAADPLASDSKAIGKVLKDKFCYNAPTSGDEKTGKKNKENWFTSYSTTFRIRASGSVGSQERSIESVIERVVPDKTKKIDQAYRILYWKLI